MGEASETHKVSVIFLMYFGHGFLSVRQIFYEIRQSADCLDIIIFFEVIYVFQIASVVFFGNTFGPA